MRELDARARREFQRVQMHDGAVAAGRVIELAGIGLGVGDQLLHVLHGQRGRHQQHAGGIGHMRDRREILLDVVGQARHQMRRNRMRAARGEQQRRAIRSRLHAFGRTNRAARTGLVVDDELLAQILRNALRDHARNQIGRTARRKRHDHAHRLARPRIGGGVGKRRRTAQRTSSHQCTDHRTTAPLPRCKRLVHGFLVLSRKKASILCSPERWHYQKFGKSGLPIRQCFTIGTIESGKPRTHRP